MLCLPSILWNPIDRLAVGFDILRMVSWWWWWWGDDGGGSGAMGYLSD